MARFARRARMRSAGDFAGAFERGKRLHEGPFTAVVAVGAERTLRLGLAVPRRAMPLATQRNRVKRQIRESFRGIAEMLPPLHIVILARTAAGKSSNVALREALSRLWKRIAHECRTS